MSRSFFLAFFGAMVLVSSRDVLADGVLATPQSNACAGAEQDPQANATCRRTQDRVDTTVSKRSWYGWQSLTTVGLSLAPVAIVPSGPTALLAVSGVYLGPPIVHWAHGNVETGFVSLGAGVGLTILGGGLGYAVSGDCPRYDEGGCAMGRLGVSMVGAILGTATYLIVDSAVLAYDEPSSGAEKNNSHRGRLEIIPSLSIGQNRGEFQLVGAF